MGPESDPTQVYALNPDHMEQSIQQFLTPVIDKLANIGSGYVAAQGEVEAAYGSETPGWFGGEGNGEVKLACGAFLGEVKDQLAALVADQNELTTSLQDYRTMLLQHIQWARETDEQRAQDFRAIERQLDELGWS